jgi:hypothetical protein
VLKTPLSIFEGSRPAAWDRRFARHSRKRYPGGRRCRSQRPRPRFHRLQQIFPRRRRRLLEEANANLLGNIDKAAGNSQDCSRIQRLRPERSESLGGGCDNRLTQIRATTYGVPNRAPEPSASCSSQLIQSHTPKKDFLPKSPPPGPLLTTPRKFEGTVI